MISSDDLDRRIRLERLIETNEDTYGEPQQSWALIAEVWAARRELSTRDRFLADQSVADSLVEWVIRYRSDVGVRVRVVHEGVVYALLGAPQELGRREWLRLLTQRLNA